jgi:hypothetical protein
VLALTQMMSWRKRVRVTVGGSQAHFQQHSSYYDSRNMSLPLALRENDLPKRRKFPEKKCLR